jgi:hypothetical protein
MKESQKCDQFIVGEKNVISMAKLLSSTIITPQDNIVVCTYLCSNLTSLHRPYSDGSGSEAKCKPCNDSRKTHAVRMLMRRCRIRSTEGNRIYTASGAI